MNILIVIAAVLISGAVCIPVGMTIRKKTAETKISSAESEAKRLLENAKRDAENINFNLSDTEEITNAYISSLDTDNSAEVCSDFFRNDRLMVFLKVQRMQRARVRDRERAVP